ncbi:DUF3019 domain-containing protein [Chromatiaceae bacterium AAb-1]|nr:DUF3019 domain-containing protein [Chromatiaceae bacterium AAb-1]
MRSFFALIVLTVFSTLAYTQPLACDEELCWIVSPVICVTQQAEQSCQTELNVSWQSQQPRDLCLYLAEHQLWCWQQATTGNWQQQTDWQSASLSLRDARQQVLVATELHILSRQPVRRRRIAAPWSIF